MHEYCTKYYIIEYYIKLVLTFILLAIFYCYKLVVVLLYLLKFLIPILILSFSLL